MELRKELKSLLKITNLCETIKRNTIFLLIILIFFLTNSCSRMVYAKLFYKSKDENKLVYETRKVVGTFNKEKQLRNVVEELFLGPVTQELGGIFKSEAKVLGLYVEKKDVWLNVNKETFEDVEDVNLVFQSISHTISKFNPQYKRVYIMVNGVQYNIIGTKQGLEEGVQAKASYLAK